MDRVRDPADVAGPQERVSVGRVVGCHGLRGELKVQHWTDDPSRFGELESVLVEKESLPRAVQSWRPHKGHVLLLLEGVADRNAAEALRGRTLSIPRTERRALPEDRWYHDELIGLEVRDPGGAPVGTVRGFDEASGGGLLSVARTSGGWLEVPFAEAWVPEVHVEEGYLVVAARWRQLVDPEDV